MYSDPVDIIHMPTECTPGQSFTVMRALSHNKLPLNMKKRHNLENLYVFTLSYSNVTAKSKKIAGGSGMGSNFEMNNTKLNSVSLIKKKKEKRKVNQNEISTDSNNL